MEKATRPKLSIIIVSYNTKELLIGCLSSILKSLENVDFEIIVVDNHSEDGSTKEVQTRFPQVRLIENQNNKGFAAANNQGLREMRGEFALLLNPDTIVGEEAIDKMVEFMKENDDVGILGPKIINPDGSLQASAFSYPTLIDDIILGFRSNLFFTGKFISHYHSRLYHLPDHPFRVDWVSGACLMIRKKTIEDIGLLDERLFLFAEDLDWCLRAKNGGWKVIYFPRACIVHYGGQSTKKNLQMKIWSFYFKRFYFAKKYRGRFSMGFLKFVPFFELLAKMCIVKMKRRMDHYEKENRLLGYKKSIKLIFQKSDLVCK